MGCCDVGRHAVSVHTEVSKQDHIDTSYKLWSSD
ncbi:hypothetical protein NP493_2753g00000 [Ridgeia piscesae]|uniref:Uncharacterized protein n=1 Tax=Ridgeia piscesae TaxID=27915 RepID=A0AAD9JE23_RIDPI|nr:hypothetical protein NP493_2753g00000 [Ridgeia piscesae]